MNTPLHASVFICPASDHLPVSLPCDWGGAAWTREVREEEETRHVLPVGSPGSKALRTSVPTPDTTAGPYPRSMPCLPKCPLPMRSLSGPFGHRRWQLPCHDALPGSFPSCLVQARPSQRAGTTSFLLPGLTVQLSPSAIPGHPLPLHQVCTQSLLQRSTNPVQMSSFSSLERRIDNVRPREAHLCPV